MREFPGATRGARKTKEKAIRFICLADAADAPNSEGYSMKLSQWNRFRNDTFKDRRDDELPFIPGQAPAAEGVIPRTTQVKINKPRINKTFNYVWSCVDVSCVFWVLVHFVTLTVTH